MIVKNFNSFLLLSALSVCICESIFMPFNGNSLQNTDPCYDERGNARRCIPDFVNAAFGQLVQSSSVCGDPPTRFCDSNTDERTGEIVRNCHECDASNPARAHPPSYLTDLNNPNNLTCWVSEPFTNPNANVTLTLSLKKKYELTYISLQFCARKPDSLAIYKSLDYGVTWHPFQYYSSQCRKVYGRQNRAAITKANEQEPLCSDSNLDPMPGGRIAFSTLEGRPSAYDFDNSPVLQDWVTATDIKIVFNRIPGDLPSQFNQQFTVNKQKQIDEQQQFEINSLDNSNSKLSEDRNEDSYQADDSFVNSNNYSSIDNTAKFELQSNNLNTYSENALNSQNQNSLDAFHYAVSDLAVGGRCKCNGHASRCIKLRDGSLGCDCKHNTAGRDCEKCKPFHFDKPWGRATATDAHECKACNCNGHARKCRFNMELYKLSGKKSGGVCLNCRHHTRGRHCHYCQEGYYRDANKPMSHPKACIPCDCHPIGSSGRTCNQTTGQCPCKDGVTGLQCSLCAKGYQQSNSPIAPCIKIPQSRFEDEEYNENNEDNSAETDTSSEKEDCSNCKVNMKQLNLRRYCKRDYAVHVNVISKEIIGSWARFTVDIENVYKYNTEVLQRGQTQSLWVSIDDLNCKCPKLRIKSSYLIIGMDEKSLEAQGGLVADRKSIVLEWNNIIHNRIRKIHKQESAGKCVDDDEY